MPVTTPATTGTFGNLSLVALSAIPTNLAAATVANITAGKNITCHMVGDWWPTASVSKVSRQRKMCQTSVTESLGDVTHQMPALQYTYRPQSVGTPAAPGNEAYEALPEGSVVALIQRIGKGGKTDLMATDKYRAFVVKLGPQVPSTSAEDAGGEATITQEIAFADGYEGPIDGVVAA